MLLMLLLMPLGSAQHLPHPHESLVHHPLTIYSEMVAIRDKNPAFIELGAFGESEAGLGLWFLDFAAPDVQKSSLPVFYLDANHHGNEQLGMEALLLFLDELADWSLTPEGAARLGEVRVVGAPMINPDGTGRNNRVNTNLVDLNRNYDYNWGLYGTSDTADPTGGTYRGDHALSEPESAANAALMAQLRPAVYLSMHTGSHDIVLPWRAYDADGRALDGPMPDWAVYERYLGEIQNVSGLGYRDPSGAGESISHAYGNLGTISLIVEVDTLQSELIVDGRPERLKEEIAIFWHTLNVLENIGGRLLADAGRVCNVGWGPAYNATVFQRLHEHEARMFASRIAPGECVEVPALEDGAPRAVRYQRTAIAAERARAVGALHVSGPLVDVGTLVPVADTDAVVPATPAVLLLVALGGASFALRRRAA